MTYFPEPFVKESLKKHDIPTGQREAIQKALASKDKEVITLIEEKASQMTPNPLKDPSQDNRQSNYLEKLFFKFLQMF